MSDLRNMLGSIARPPEPIRLVLDDAAGAEVPSIADRVSAWWSSLPWPDGSWMLLVVWLLLAAAGVTFWAIQARSFALTPALEAFVRIARMQGLGPRSRRRIKGIAARSGVAPVSLLLSEGALHAAMRHGADAPT